MALERRGLLLGAEKPRERHGVTEAEFFGPRFTRIKRIQALQADGRLDEDLRWRKLATTGARA